MSITASDQPRIVDCGHSVITIDDSEDGRVWSEDEQCYLPVVVVRMTPWYAERQAQILAEWSEIADMMDEGEERSERRFAGALMHAALVARSAGPMMLQRPASEYSLTSTASPSSATRWCDGAARSWSDAYLAADNQVRGQRGPGLGSVRSCIICGCGILMIGINKLSDRGNLA
jgi:hypothetical protein